MHIMVWDSGIRQRLCGLSECLSAKALSAVAAVLGRMTGKGTSVRELESIFDPDDGTRVFWMDTNDNRGMCTCPEWPSFEICFH